MRSLRALMFVCVVAAALASGSGSAVASAARVQLEPFAAVNAGSSIKAAWVAHRAGASRVVIQRQEGTEHVWRTIATLRGGRGTFSLPGLSLGFYRLRIAAFSRKGRLLAQQQRSLSVFGYVPLSAVFGAKDAGTYTTPTATFSYVLLRNDGGGDGTGAFGESTKNACRAIHIDFIPGSTDGDPEDRGLFDYTGTVSLVQASSDPVSASMPFDDKGSLDATLIPGQSWSVNLSSAGPNKGCARLFPQRLRHLRSATWLSRLRADPAGGTLVELSRPSPKKRPRFFRSHFWLSPSQAHA
jgi:hypothetical protein